MVWFHSAPCICVFIYAYILHMTSHTHVYVYIYIHTHTYAHTHYIHRIYIYIYLYISVYVADTLEPESRRGSWMPTTGPTCAGPVSKLWDDHPTLAYLRLEPPASNIGKGRTAQTWWTTGMLGCPCPCINMNQSSIYSHFFGDCLQEHICLVVYGVLTQTNPYFPLSARIWHFFHCRDWCPNKPL